MKHKVCKNLIGNSYLEWWRDWPDETQQPVHLYKVLIPAVFIPRDERGFI
jgi:hypothetical protein